MTVTHIFFAKLPILFIELVLNTGLNYIIKIETFNISTKDINICIEKKIGHKSRIL